MGLDLEKYLSLYVAEAGDHLAAFANGLLALEKAVATGEGDRKALVDGVFRHAHSVKGMSASMALDGIAALAHSAEDLVDAFRRFPAAVDGPAVDLLLSAGDALTAMVKAAAGGAKPPGDPVLAVRLKEAAERARAPAGPSTPPALSVAAKGREVEGLGMNGGDEGEDDRSNDRTPSPPAQRPPAAQPRDP
ncbi:MAG TPA: Hpt domain-containing protein, partial [Anaeromyxobacteraceae bacterium]|nr:Hpt domain-containing protein [Anaeromyxobacteraceae bacterium]